MYYIYILFIMEKLEDIRFDVIHNDIIHGNRKVREHIQF